MDKLKLEMRDDAVAVLTLTDPERRNAMGEEMAAELQEVALRVRGWDEVAALVVTGEGSAFCAGVDLPGLFGDAEDLSTAALRERLRRYYRGFLDLRELEIPTVAAVQGAAVGAGLNLALACDVRFVAPDASLGATFARIGLHPGGGCTWFLVRELGPSRALRVLLRGDSISGEQAVAWGIAEGPEADPLAAATAFAVDVARSGPALARNIKAAARLALETDDLDAVLAFEAWAQADSARSERFRGWVEKFR